MSLAELRIADLRCLESATLEFSPELNLIAGENGAGKTSILEAIFLLGRGRSFRTRSSERLIRHGQPKLTVFGRTDDQPARFAGIEVSSDGGTRARINGEAAQSLLELSGILPVQAIDPEIHKLVDQGPERRRRWLDWLVFHVEPSFAIHWSRYNRALKQRNAALRAGSGALERLVPRLSRTFDRFGGLDVSVGFSSGWTADTEFEDSLRQHRERDRQ